MPDGAKLNDPSAALVGPQPAADPLEMRLDLLRGEFGTQFEVLTMLLEIARIYAAIPRDDDLERAMLDAKDAFKAALAIVAKLQSERRNAELTRQAAIEWRAQSGRRRGA